jgi:hypothetical protein
MRNGAEQKSKQGVVGIATKKEGDDRKKRLWLVVVVIFGGRFRCNQSFAGATELGQETKCQEGKRGKRERAWGRIGMEDGE